MTDALDLLPCPFCGSDAKRKPRLHKAKGVKCHECAAWGPAWEKPDGSEWNARADHALELVAEAYEVAARECEGSNLGLDPADVADDIRFLTPSNAFDAREARDKRVRDEALREAISATLQITYHDDRDDCLAADVIESLMKGNDNEQ